VPLDPLRTDPRAASRSRPGPLVSGGRSYRASAVILAAGLLLLNVVTVLRLQSESGGDAADVTGRIALGLGGTILLIALLAWTGRRAARLDVQLGEDGIRWTDRGRQHHIPWPDLQLVRFRACRVIFEGSGHRLSVPLVELLPAERLDASPDDRTLLSPLLESVRRWAPHARLHPTALEDWS
jgi:hypothetical protein